MADQEEPGCWQKKAAYEQCFDKWYTEVFLQHKAHGKVGCQKEYEAYTRCYLVRYNFLKLIVIVVFDMY
ncbi:hypothetical protein P3T76_004076 [Phytophthora citrophthora]|uniref:Uncharacterized protein n=1 Tax=Phytophthora citrophthora TaxID=4793 RepID=A0AAD9GT65_9STRA|nr:hypothetical protein P3T76_004076 [Phytophthora citrophthora]